MTKKANANQKDEMTDKPVPMCGLVMPISPIENCDSEHWKEVRDILEIAISEAGFNSRMVSEANETSVIQTNIINNLYSDELVVVDVSCKNPNVMFELGLRLAFDKPTIIVKDYETQYSFDTSGIQHLEYPRSLRYHEMKNFQKALTKKVKDTYQTSQEKGADYSPFLGQYSKIKAGHIETKELDATQLVDMINETHHQIQSLSYNISQLNDKINTKGESVKRLSFSSNHPIKDTDKNSILELYNELRQNKGLDFNNIELKNRDRMKNPVTIRFKDANLEDEDEDGDNDK